ncbi:protein DDI1 homolog 2 isoform X1 [Notolabrus celidotus]|uniref:protein DDI1 homolog 2 isoform X1 n=1 Tax=Notolabrus celidotus TaxID=1203425 RepID=UPI00148FBEF2|nr:protein DDI1 homolog 2 isoform X1 [Notolabrus celidotus]
MSSSTSPSQNLSSGQTQTLDRSQSAPATITQGSASRLCEDPPGVQELPLPMSPKEDVGSASPQVQPHPLPVQNSSKVQLVPNPSANVPPTPADLTTVSEYTGDEVQPGAAEGDAESDMVLPNPEEFSPFQPMEQEGTKVDTVDAAEACPSAPSQPDSVEMESPTASQCAVSSERDQPDGEHSSSSDSIPSLAAALKELHELLVSNNRSQSQNRSNSCSPSDPFRQETEDVLQEPRTLTPVFSNIPSTAITAGAEPSDAKADHAAAAAAAAAAAVVAVSDEGPSKCFVPDIPGQDEHPGGDSADTAEKQGPPDCPGDSEKGRADRLGGDEANNISTFQPGPEVPSNPAEELEFREPPEGQQGRGVADGRASGSNTPDTLLLQTEHPFISPLSMAVGSPEEVTSTSSSSSPPLSQAAQVTSPAPLPPHSHPFIEQFPAEHIQRIQAAGFSAMEAAEALQQAHGVVELALLALLARSITVPT